MTKVTTIADLEMLKYISLKELQEQIHHGDLSDLTQLQKKPSRHR
jgi:hypothetical protein